MMNLAQFECGCLLLDIAQRLPRHIGGEHLPANIGRILEVIARTIAKAGAASAHGDHHGCEKLMHSARSVIRGCEYALLHLDGQASGGSVIWPYLLRDTLQAAGAVCSGDAAMAAGELQPIRERIDRLDEQLAEDLRGQPKIRDAGGPSSGHAASTHSG